MITLGDAIPVLAKYCGTGKSADNPTVVDDINQAVEVLMNKPKNWTYTTQNLIFCAPNGQFTMPREVGKILRAQINGTFSEVRSQWFEYMSNGPGLLEDQSFDWLTGTIDRGFVPTQYDLPYGIPMYLSIVSDRTEDKGAKILIRGHDDTGREVRVGTLFGENILIRGGESDEMWVSENLFMDITSIEKPVTKGYVYLSGILPDTGVRYFLSSMHPDETRPSYRRYFIKEIPEHHPTDVEGNYVIPTPYRIDALCRLRYVPATHNSDILLIQNLGALKHMLKALRLEDADQLEEAMKYEATAERRMNEMTACLENDETTVDISPMENLGSGLGILP